MGRTKKTEGIAWLCEPYLSTSLQTLRLAEPELAWDKTLLISSVVDNMDDYKVRRGFNYLGKWDLVIPLDSAGHSLEDILDSKNRVMAKEYIPDLRIPVLFTGFMWWSIRAARTFKLWRELDEIFRCGSLSLMIAIYKTCPYVMVVPTSWIEKGIPDFSTGPKGMKVYVENIAKFDLERAGKVFKAGHKKRIFLPMSLEAEIRACPQLKITKE